MVVIPFCIAYMILCIYGRPRLKNIEVIKGAPDFVYFVAGIMLMCVGMLSGSVKYLAAALITYIFFLLYYVWYDIYAHNKSCRRKDILYNVKWRLKG